MTNILFQNITAFINGLPFPEAFYLNETCFLPGKTIEEDDDLSSFQKIIQKKRASRSKVKEEISYVNGRNLTAGLKKKQKYHLFILLFYHYYNSAFNNVFTGYKSGLRLIADILDISKSEFNAAFDFYSASAPFLDKTDCLYLAGKKTGRLVSSKGVNVDFCLKNSEEIIYLRYVCEYELFLSKTFSTVKTPHMINEIVQMKELNIYNRQNFELCGIQHDFNACLNLINDFDPFKSVVVSSTDTAPEIILDSDLSKIIISGNSTPLSPSNYFEPIYDWLNNYKLYGKSHLELHIRLYYFNTYTSKFLLRLISKCKSLRESGRKIRVFWYCAPEDDEMVEFGEQMQSIFERKFTFLAGEQVSKIRI